MKAWSKNRVKYERVRENALPRDVTIMSARGEKIGTLPSPLRYRACRFSAVAGPIFIEALLLEQQHLTQDPTNTFGGLSFAASGPSLSPSSTMRMVDRCDKYHSVLPARLRRYLGPSVYCVFSTP